MTPLLVLGVGNPILGDDGLGPRAVAALAAEGGLPPGTRVTCGWTGGLDLLPLIEDAERLVIVDGVDVGARPGEVVRFAGHEIPLRLGPALSPHQVGLQEVLALCRLRGTGPSEEVLWGVQVERVEGSTQLSEPVEAALPALLDGVRREARRMLLSPAEAPP